MKRLSLFTALAIIVSIVAFSLHAVAMPGDPKAPAAKDGKSCCRQAGTASAGQCTGDMKASTVSDTKGATADMKDCPYVNGKCPMGKCDMKAMKASNSSGTKDCCKKGMKTAKASRTSKAKKATTASAVSGTN